MVNPIIGTTFQASEGAMEEVDPPAQPLDDYSLGRHLDLMRDPESDPPNNATLEF